MSSNADVLIVIPARYHSSRLPGKPLATIAGQTLLERVWRISSHVAQTLGQIDIQVATEDSRIADYCQQHNMNVVVTSDQCRSGTERVYETVSQLDHPANFIVNLQGDNALCPPWFLVQLINAYRENPQQAVFTPFVKLNWSELDTLREAKTKTPFSGTTVVYDQRGRAQWFSKQIIPAIRNEHQLRDQQTYSPVARHIGLYGYDRRTLLNLPNLASSAYGDCEGLEQLDFLENGVMVQMVEVGYREREGMNGIDSPADIERAERIIRTDGELLE